EDQLYLMKLQQKAEDLTKIRQFIKDRFTPENEYYIEWRSKVTESVRTIYLERFDQPENQLKVSPFIRTADKPYLPGSSIKGAFRTALLNSWSRNIDKHKDNTKAQNIEAEIYGGLRERRDRPGSYYADISSDPFRALKVRDIFLPDESTVFSKVSNFNIKDDKLNETNIQIICEVTTCPLSFELEIGIDEELFKIRESGLKKVISLKDLLEVTNNFYIKILHSEKARLFDGRAEKIAEIYKKIEDAGKGGYLLRLGWGSGFESMTIEKFRQPALPEKIKGGWGFSKHLVEEKFPLGWVKLILEG
ncbi:type III-A CRISPR-associated RAMP protein Csm5, partial [bacterium]|nr:type III-A CRISPR-associated RAMP protein Csm5 [bacterium]